ncbi:hypothetical protein ACQY74_004318 [Rhizobium leguminosarum bv. trifolii]
MFTATELEGNTLGKLASIDEGGVVPMYESGEDFLECTSVLPMLGTKTASRAVLDRSETEFG